MSCLIQLLEDQNDLLRTQVKNAGLSHDAQHARIAALEADNARLRDELDPQPPMMTGTVEPAAEVEGDKKGEPEA